MLEASINSSRRDINLAARYVSLDLRNKSWEISILDCILNDESECLLGYGRASGKKLDASSVLRNMEFRELEKREKPGGLKKSPWYSGEYNWYLMFPTPNNFGLK